MQRFLGVDQARSDRLLWALGATTAFVVLLGGVKSYSFFPDRLNDNFLAQIQHVGDLISGGEWHTFLDDPLAIVHFLRFVAVWPFMLVERLFGSSAPLLLLCLLLWPLLIVFRPWFTGWKAHTWLCLRLLMLLFPLVVSGRTVLVTVAMAYLVLGTISTPFSWRKMSAGCAFAVLSSASILFSIAILLLAGNWAGRPRKFYAIKAALIICLLCVFMPSLTAKATGFSTGAPGYKVEQCLSSDSLGHGPIAATQRVLVRSTAAQSYCEGNLPKLIIYLMLSGTAIIYVIYSKFTQRKDPLRPVLMVLSTGIFLEGLALWPILFPLLWAYTGYILITDTEKQFSVSESTDVARPFSDMSDRN